MPVTKAIDAVIPTSGARIYQTPVTLTDGATVTLDWTVTNRGHVTFAGNRTIAFSGPVAGQTYTLRIKQDATGNRTVTWPSSGVTINWPGGADAVLSTAANAIDVIVITCVDATPSAEIYDAAVAMANLS